MGGDFRRLWAAYGVSEFGTALSMGALPLIATLVLHSGVLQVSLLSALSVLAGAAIAVPLGPWIEFRRKRPVMIGADLVRFAAMVSLPLAAWAHVLTYGQLCLVAVVQAGGGIVFNAASGAHLKALVPTERRGSATARFEGTFWTVYSIGPAIGGVLISWLGATATVALDGVSFLLSALGIRRLRGPEPPPPARHPEPDRWGEITAGWRYILHHRELRALYWNSLLFGGGVMAIVPLQAILLLRELGITPWQYGLALGIPCVGGVIGAAINRPLTRRYGQRAVLLGFGLSRGLWLVALPFTPAGVPGLTVWIVAQSLLLISAGGFNPGFMAFRMDVTPDDHQSRVSAAWSISNRVAQPLCITLAGAAAATFGTRPTLALLATLILASTALLPWRARAERSEAVRV